MPPYTGTITRLYLFSLEMIINNLPRYQLCILVCMSAKQGLSTERYSSRQINICLAHGTIGCQTHVLWIILQESHIQFVKPLKSKLAPNSFFLSYSRGFLHGGQFIIWRRGVNRRAWQGGCYTGGTAGCRCWIGWANIVGNVTYFNYLFHLSSFVPNTWSIFIWKPILKYNRNAYLVYLPSDSTGFIM